MVKIKTIGKISFGLILMLLIFACASSQKYDQSLNKWIGQSEQSLLQSWGKPSAQKYLSSHSKIITYTKIKEVFIPSEYYFYGDGWGDSDLVYDPFMSEYDFSPYEELVDSEVEEVCQTSFKIDNGFVTSWQWRGNNCVAN